MSFIRRRRPRPCEPTAPARTRTGPARAAAPPSHPALHASRPKTGTASHTRGDGGTAALPIAGLCGRATACSASSTATAATGTLLRAGAPPPTLTSPPPSTQMTPARRRTAARRRGRPAPHRPRATRPSPWPRGRGSWPRPGGGKTGCFLERKVLPPSLVGAARPGTPPHGQGTPVGRAPRRHVRRLRIVDKSGSTTAPASLP